MATKKKTKKKLTRSKKTTSRKVMAKKTLAQKRKTAKKASKRKTAPKKAVKKKSLDKKTIGGKAAGAGAMRTRKEGEVQDALGSSREASRSRSGQQSGDLQGLSHVESADSESVDELIEEGNPFEAGVVSGVEDAGDHGEKEVRTREVPEDDVPGEYLDDE